VTAADAPLADATKEVERLLDIARRLGVPLRVMGGLAVQMHAGDQILQSLQREPKDIDLVTVRGKSSAAGELMEGAGYTPSPQFNQLNGHRRLLFHDLANKRRVDVFVGAFEMCHVIPIAERIELDSLSIPLAELLLTKLQVVSLNEKDQRDIVAILAYHEVGASDDDAVNGAYVARLCARDWGLWRTTKMNLQRTKEALPRYELPPERREAVIKRTEELWRMIEAEPKGTKWRLRSQIGDRIRWYEEPEEVA
jgi:hypothetical protein